MSDGKVTRMLTFHIMALIPALVQLAESMFGNKTGKEKKAAVLEFIRSAMEVAGVGAAFNNPKFAEAISKAIDTAAEMLFPSKKTAPDNDGSSPAAPTHDEIIAARYESETAAREHTSRDYPNVLMYPDHPKYGVWPNVGPLPNGSVIVYTLEG